MCRTMSYDYQGVRSGVCNGLYYALGNTCACAAACSCCAFDFPTKGILQEAVKHTQYDRLKDSSVSSHHLSSGVLEHCDLRPASPAKLKRLYNTLESETFC